MRRAGGAWTAVNAVSAAVSSAVSRAVTPCRARVAVLPAGRDATVIRVSIRARTMGEVNFG